MTIRLLDLGNEKLEMGVVYNGVTYNPVKDGNKFITGSCVVNLKCGFNILVELNRPQTINQVLNQMALKLNRKMEGLH